jgi:exodeoxyribonuclease VII large subunit
MGTSMAPGADAAPRVYTVSELTRLIRAVLEEAVGAVWVEGELSNVRQPASGHYYFTVKDESAQISAVLFRGNQRGLRFQPKDGLLVRVFGEISVYERSGNYQIIVRRIEEGGQGALLARFEALKRKLEQEGLFDPARRKPIPLLPRHIGIVTSPTGAALRDMLKVFAQRFPNLHILLAPVRVQGEGAAVEIAAALDLLNARGGLDVIIAGRGGGSIEDLWCFNEEIVARAIARSRIPVISAVGHEIDVTISDFVADLRAPTPSAAAEMVVGRKDAFEERLGQAGGRLARALRQAALEARNRLLAVSRRCGRADPALAARKLAQRLDGLQYRLGRRMEAGAREGQQRLDDAGLRLSHGLRMGIEAGRHRTRNLEGRLGALNPLAVLKRGYTITSDRAGGIIRSARAVRPGQRLVTQFTDGSVESDAVEETQP